MLDKAEYRGDEARAFVEALVDNYRMVMRPVVLRQPDKPIRVRVQVGEEPGRDLAELLVEAGLALRAPSSYLSEEQQQAIREAEGRARTAARGLHDGGLQEFLWTQNTTIDLGTAFWQPDYLQVNSGRSLQSVASSIR